jgi:hypothetical protein
MAEFVFLRTWTSVRVDAEQGHQEKGDGCVEKFDKGKWTSDKWSGNNIMKFRP